MEITCKRCYTEYDFDDALVSERGTTVRCTHCGEQFKVFRAPSAMPERWVINRNDGRELVFTNLRDLQQAIVNMQVGRHDLLTHGGESPRPLGSIAELEPFFGEGAGQSPVPAPSPGVVERTAPPQDLAPRAGRATAPPFDGPPVPALARDSLLQRPQVSVNDPYAHSGLSDPGRRAGGSLAGELGGVPSRPDPRPLRSREAPPSGEDEQEWFDEPRFTSVVPARSRAMRWLVVLTFLGVLGIGLVAVGRKYVPLGFRAPAAASTAEARFESLLEEGNRSLSEGDLEMAKESFDKASVLAERDPRVLSGLARLEVIRGDADWLKVRLLPGEPAEGIAAARRQAEQSAARALKAADRAAAVSPDDPMIVRAKIDALRLAGDLGGARTLVPQVTAIAAQPETIYALAALDLSEHAPNWPVVIERLKSAAAGEPNAPGARAALVYALVRSGDLSLGRAELEKISASARPYVLLPELSSFVGRAGGATPTGPRADVARREVLPVTAPARLRASSEPRPEPESTGTDFRTLLERASQSAGARQYDRAEQLYRMALVKNPGDTEALGGLGDVARARGNTGLARTYYEQVLSRNPQYVPSLGALADLDWETGDKASAAKRYSDVLDISPVGPLADRARRRIAEAQAGSEPKTGKSAEPGVKPTPPAASPADLPPSVDTSDLPGFHR